MTPAKSTEAKVVNEELAVDALAKAVYEGDIVNFRLIFMPFSPARKKNRAPGRLHAARPHWRPRGTFIKI